MKRSKTSTIAPVLAAGVLAAFGLEGLNIVVRSYSLYSYEAGVILGALLGVAVHEYMHMKTARVYGCRAGFAFSNLGLLLTLASGVLRSINLLGFTRPPIAFIAPGYVVTYCREPSPRVQADIALAGPASNLMLAGLGYAIAQILPELGQGLALINTYLALFNLIPVPPLDGSQAIRGRPGLWALMLGLAVLMAYYPYIT